MRLFAIPAYARQYDGKEDCLKDWEGNKDFKIAGGPYFSIRDVEGLKAAGYREIFISQLSFNPKNQTTVLITL